MMAKKPPKLKVVGRKNKRTTKAKLKNNLGLRAYIDNVFNNL